MTLSNILRGLGGLAVLAGVILFTALAFGATPTSWGVAGGLSAIGVLLYVLGVRVGIMAARTAIPPMHVLSKGAAAMQDFVVALSEDDRAFFSGATARMDARAESMFSNDRTS